MRNNNKYLLTLFILLLYNASFAQNKREKKAFIHNDDIRLKLIADSCRDYESNNYSLTNSNFKNKNWPNEITSNGETGHLFRTNKFGEPEYIFPLDQGSVLSINAHQLQTGGNLNKNYRGNGFLLGIWESYTQTFSNGKYNRHYYPLVTHQDFQVGNMSRVTIGPEDPGEQNLMNLYNYSISGHATLVSGIAGSDSNSNNGNTRGVAPGISINAFTDYHVLSELANMCLFPNNLLASNHSYGTPIVPNYYDGYWLNNILHAAPYHLAVFAEGNYWLSYYAATKNGMSVGSAFQVLNYSGPQNVISPNYFMHKGTPDYRIKPELVAKSQNVSGAHSNHNANYIYNFNGSSLSAPSVSAGALLLQEMYKDYTNYFMLGTTLKGLMIHTAKEAGTIGPDAIFGFGLLDLEAAAQHIIDNGTNTIIKEDFLAENISKEIKIYAQGTELKATLVWNDPPCSNCIGSGRQLVNDLDIKLISSNGVHLPWGLDSTNPTGPAIRLNNTRDNVEHITIPNTTPGEVFKVIISHKGQFPANDNTQVFSLLMSGVGNCAQSSLDSIIKTNNVVPSSYEIDFAKKQLIARNNIMALANVDYSSAEELLLNDGFTSDNSSSFLGHISKCDSLPYSSNFAKNPLRAPILYSNESVKNVTKPAKIELYPNPTEGVFTIKMENSKSGKCMIRSTSGAIILEQVFTNKQELNMNQKNQLAKGIYIVELQTDKYKTETYKLIIQ